MVFHGSVLGLLLILIYINDIMNFSDLATLILFADDTKGDNDSSMLIKTVNIVLDQFSQWFNANNCH